MRYSRVLSGDMYFTTTAVLFSEFSKMVVCLLIIFYQQRSNFLSHLHEAIVVNWLDTLKMSVPAIVYMLQNNLQYVAVSNLEAAVFQVSISGYRERLGNIWAQQPPPPSPQSLRPPALHTDKV